jgi:hypothetical protein
MDLDPADFIGGSRTPKGKKGNHSSKKLAKKLRIGPSTYSLPGLYSFRVCRG